jgi:hypothetical protein
LDSCFGEKALSEVGTDAYDEVCEDWNGGLAIGEGERLKGCRSAGCCSCAWLTETGQKDAAAFELMRTTAMVEDPSFIIQDISLQWAVER